MRIALHTGVFQGGTREDADGADAVLPVVWEP